jgi:hypothetical protein
MFTKTTTILLVTIAALTTFLAVVILILLQRSKKLTCRFLFRAEGTEEFRPITNPGPASLPRQREVAVLTRNKT